MSRRRAAAAVTLVVVIVGGFAFVWSGSRRRTRCGACATAGHHDQSRGADLDLDAAFDDDARGAARPGIDRARDRADHADGHGAAADPRVHNPHSDDGAEHPTLGARDGWIAARALAGGRSRSIPATTAATTAHTAEISRPIFIGTQTRACDTTGTADRRRLHRGGVQPRRRAAARAASCSRRAREVVMTRTTNDGWGPCIDERAAIGNRAHADASRSRSTPTAARRAVAAST